MNCLFRVFLVAVGFACLVFLYSLIINSLLVELGVVAFIPWYVHLLVSLSLGVVAFFYGRSMHCGEVASR